jgi:hypothetical protein
MKVPMFKLGQTVVFKRKKGYRSARYGQQAKVLSVEPCASRESIPVGGFVMVLPEERTSYLIELTDGLRDFAGELELEGIDPRLE